LENSLYTFGPDAAALIFGGLLLWFSIRHYKQILVQKEEHFEEMVKSLKVSLVNSYKFWAWIVLILLSINGIVTCNVLSLFFIVLSSICFYIWA